MPTSINMVKYNNFSQAFCCHRPDPLMSPRHGVSYATFGDQLEKTQEYYDESKFFKYAWANF